jgi:surface antigen
MAKFEKRLTQPKKTNKYYNSNINPYVLAGYGMFQNNGNCTAYAYGRFYELLGSRPKLSTRNAENWWGHNDGYQRGQTPKLGAVVCWRKGQAGNSSDGAGHVAIVEEIYDNGDILISNSSWKQYLFKTKVYTKASNYTNGLSSSFKFQGFIYTPIEFEEEKPKQKYTTGDYVTLCNMNVRSGAGTDKPIKKVKDLTTDGKKNATSTNPNANAVYKKGTIFTALEIIDNNGTWARTPSGYICIQDSKDTYCKKQ